MRRSIMRAVGAYLPERIVTNDDLARELETSDAWIRERTGIRERRIAAPGELTSDLATHAARRALERAGIAAEAVDLVIVATSTPDHTFPATATAVQRNLEMGPGIAFDLQAVCAGFAYALATADNFIKVGQAETALVIGAETFSRILDWTDRSTCVLFGDGAGAVVLSAAEQPGTSRDQGILATTLAADGRQYAHLQVDGGPSSTGTVGFLRMNGREVFRHAVTQLSNAANAVLDQAGLRIEDVDWLIPHQANQRIIEAVGKRLQIPTAKVVMTLAEHANTSAASIPLALAELDASGRLRRGDLLLMNAMGGGFAWGAALARW